MFIYRYSKFKASYALRSIIISSDVVCVCDAITFGNKKNRQPVCVIRIVARVTIRIIVTYSLILMYITIIILLLVKRFTPVRATVTSISADRKIRNIHDERSVEIRSNTIRRSTAAYGSVLRRAVNR